jgi:hypothetical protein
MCKITEKKIYSSPCIEQIKLDNEISLILESSNSNPGEPGTIGPIASLAPEYFNNDPFKINIG